MQVAVDDLIRRARELASDERPEDAWRVIEPLTHDVGSSVALAEIWTALAQFSDLDDRIASAATEIISRHSDHRSLVASAASVLVQVAETRPFDEAPLANGPALIAADALQGLIARLTAEERADPEIAVDLYSDLAMALRMTGSQDDESALEAMNTALRLDPDDGSSWYKLGLLHKWRGRWPAGVEANRRARELGSDGQGVLWNLAICATGAGDHDLAASLMKEMGMIGEVGEDGVFTGRFDSVQVRVSGLGEGVDPAAHVVGSDPGFENLWIERQTYVSGKIISPTYYDIPVDYGDIVLFDGAPVGYRDDGQGGSTPRFPLLQKLRSGAYQRYWFLARQPRAGFLEEVSKSLPPETFFYVHDEQVDMLCAECAKGGHVSHEHDKPESSLVKGKFIVPEPLLDAGLIELLEKALGNQAVVAIPQLFKDLGDAVRARRDEERWKRIAEAREQAGRRVVCEVHGSTSPAYVCRHLVEGENVGFFAAEGSECDRPDAWCLECEQVRIAEGGEWNDRSETFAGIQIICGRCYDRAKERNVPKVKKRRWKFWEK